jgi:ADP-heptose:LPS heptosyltransferase
MPLLPSCDNYDRVSKEFIFPYKNFYHIALCPQGSVTTKYPPKKLVKVIDDISKKYNVRFYILGSAAGEKTAQEVMSLCAGRDDVFNLCQKTSLLEVLNFISNCDMTITVDTGIAHIAAVSGKPLINICGGTDPRYCMAMSTKAKVLSYGEGCFDCSFDDNFCRTREFQFCMDKIQPESILDEAYKILDEIKK